MINLNDYVGWKLTHSDKTAEAEGYPLILEDCKKNKLIKEFKMYGNGVGDKTKNLYCADNVYLKDQGWNMSKGSCIITDSSITTYATADAEKGSINIWLYNVTDYAGKTISMSYTANPETIKFAWTTLVLYDSSGSYVNDKDSIELEEGHYYSTVTIPDDVDDTYSLRIRLYGQNLTKGCEVKIDNIMICEGTEPLAYEPANKYKIPVVQESFDIKNNILIVRSYE